MKHFHISVRDRACIFGALVLLGLFSGGYYSKVFSSGEWVTNVTQGEFLDLNPATTQWLTINNHLNAITLIDGKIAVFESKNNMQNWVEVQRFGPDDIAFTTFQVKDVNGDGQAEIIAGTIEPGFIYIYKLENGKWEIFNYVKYVWSAVTFIAVGKFGGGPEDNILVQNQEGSLFLLKMTANSLDLVWKSPAVWRPISSGYVIDIDHDLKDEIMVAYKTGGIGVLKMDSNSILSVWENYLWGKVLAVTSGDWDHDQLPELMISSSQKVIYFLGWSATNGYQFEDQWSQLNYTIERLVLFDNNGISQLLATDTAGKFHLFEYNVKSKEWQEDYVSLTGRIVQIINTDPRNVLLWGVNRRIVAVQAYLAKEIKFRYQDADYQISPAAVFKNEILYISPKSLQAVPGLNLTYESNKTNYLITLGDQKMEIAKKGLKLKVNGDEVTTAEAPIMANGDLQLPLTSYQTLLKLNLAFDALQMTVQIPNLNSRPTALE